MRHCPLLKCSLLQFRSVRLSGSAMSGLMLLLQRRRRRQKCHHQSATPPITKLRYTTAKTFDEERRGVVAWPRQQAGHRRRVTTTTRGRTAARRSGSRRTGGRGGAAATATAPDVAVGRRSTVSAVLRRWRTSTPNSRPTDRVVLPSAPIHPSPRKPLSSAGGGYKFPVSSKSVKWFRSGRVEVCPLHLAYTTASTALYRYKSRSISRGERFLSRERRHVLERRGTA